MVEIVVYVKNADARNVSCKGIPNIKICSMKIGSPHVVRWKRPPFSGKIAITVSIATVVATVAKPAPRVAR